MRDWEGGILLLLQRQRFGFLTGTVGELEGFGQFGGGGGDRQSREETYKRTMEDENGGLSLGPISSTYRQTGSQILTLIGDLCFFYNATPTHLSLSLTTQFVTTSN